MQTGLKTATAPALTGSGWPSRPDAASATAAARAAPVVTERRFKELSQQLRAEWQALAQAAAEANAFAEPWFVAAGLGHLAGDTDVRLLEVRGEAGLIGVMPLCVSRSYGRMTIRHVENWTHHHDFLGTPLIRAGAEAPFWCAILTHLDQAAWAPGFFHVNGLVEDGPVHRGLTAAATAMDRCAPVVHRATRAALITDLPPLAYYEANVRKKKRKELKRLQSRLAEIGDLRIRRLADDDSLEIWCDDFLALERSGWKGDAGSALSCAPHTEAFFRDALAGARAAGRLELLRMELDGRALAMLANFLTPPGSFTFKIAHDEEFARFSPGVLIQLANFDILARPEIEWMDSCAAENHSMIDHLWAERRSIVRVTVPLKGLGRGLVFRLCRTLESASALRRKLVTRP